MVANLPSPLDAEEKSKCSTQKTKNDIGQGVRRDISEDERATRSGHWSSRIWMWLSVRGLWKIGKLWTGVGVGDRNPDHSKERWR